MEHDRQSENAGLSREGPAESEAQRPPDSEAAETSLRERLDEALREKEQFRMIAQRAQADLVNYRRRASDEQEETRRSANSQLILKILSIVDDLERALAMVPKDAIAPGWLEGLSIVHRNLKNVLAAEGISKIDAQDRPFEPWEHEAVLYEETSKHQEGQVVRVIREGYKLHDRVLRPAQVVVAKAAGPENSSPANPTEPTR
ncbi:MAG: nucleotide exchange factor GrpE [Chloroflexi bacterium]|nr:nucleotide exchange factor GrpE [Chloroflexota bacterium]